MRNAPGTRKTSGGLLKTGIIGAVAVALCCFTPVLVILLAAVGLGALTGYLDYVLYPALLIFVGLAVYGYVMQQKTSDTSR
ncbi:MAG TPA: mercury resistance system transport protein MerF [Symbiobacteriaceae bacterium]|jgi:mercuric ion transport protein